jgi:hypothetical protein
LPNGKPPVDDRPTLILRLPRALKRKISLEAAKTERTQQDIAAQILADHFGVKYESRWPGTRAAEAREAAAAK